MRQLLQISAFTLALLALLVACRSTPVVELDQAGNIVVTNLEGVRCLRAEIFIEGIDDPIRIPTSTDIGIPTQNLNVQDGRVSFPIGPTLSRDSVTVTAIRIILDPGCATVSGVFRFTGEAFVLRRGQSQTVDFGDFSEEE